VIEGQRASVEGYICPRRPHAHSFDVGREPRAALWAALWDGCDWVRSNSNTDGQRKIGNAASPDRCIAMVKEQCPDATIANLPGDGHGRCYCQYGGNPIPQSGSDWMSCVLATPAPTAVPNGAQAAAGD